MYVVRWLREGFKLKEQSDKTRDLSIGVLFQWYHSLFLPWQLKPVTT